MDLTHVLVLLAGVVLAVWNTWQHLGRSRAARAWSDDIQGELKVRSVLVIRPMLAVVLIAAALVGPTAGADGTKLWISFPLVIALLVAFGYMVLPLPIPRWAKPRWFRSQQRHVSGRAARRG
ncbi:hypothetical protein [Nocardioides panaciterrulae]|uniref:Uncharacterized protein n=1 Tax=Nocardioides panaciterrulae TaxID=661492 RepID=A0A7Y9E438_9ACTN|nr:hypothetical protein [Nocardioides panaciterrulae]NYD40531.1 hypothetical protein [Nocardioides panaciterrulae]